METCLVVISLLNGKQKCDTPELHPPMIDAEQDPTGERFFRGIFHLPPNPVFPTQLCRHELQILHNAFQGQHCFYLSSCRLFGGQEDHRSWQTYSGKHGGGSSFVELANLFVFSLKMFLVIYC